MPFLSVLILHISSVANDKNCSIFHNLSVIGVIFHPASVLLRLTVHVNVVPDYHFQLPFYNVFANLISTTGHLRSKSPFANAYKNVPFIQHFTYWLPY